MHFKVSAKTGDGIREMCQDLAHENTMFYPVWECD